MVYRPLVSVVCCAIECSLGCASKGHPPGDAPGVGLDFSVTIAPIPTDVTEVMVDGSPQSVQSVGGVPTIVFEQMYQSYTYAESTSPITFQFYSGTTVRNTGMSGPGTCARACVTSNCPQGDGITVEDIQINPLMDFALYDFTCLRCAGPGKSDIICQ